MGNLTNFRLARYASFIFGCWYGTLTLSCGNSDNAHGAGSSGGTPSVGGMSSAGATMSVANSAAGESTIGSSGGTTGAGGSGSTGGDSSAAGVTATGGILSSGGTDATAGTPIIAGSSAGGFMSGGTGPEPSKQTITRATGPQSIFTPTELEGAINDLVAELNKVAPTNLRLDVIFKAESSYYQPTVVGAQRAMAELQVSGQTALPALTDSDATAQAQSSMMNADIAQGSKGIGLVPSTDALVTPINDAVAVGIPVVTIDVDLPDSKRDLSIGTPNRQAGITAGNTLKRFLRSGSGTVVILGQGEDNWHDGYNRTMGAKSVLDAAGYTTRVVTTNWGDNSVTLAALHDVLASSEPPAVGMLGMHSNSWQCATAAEQMGLTGADITIVAFDLDPRTIAYMQSGLIKATHALRQYYKGYLAPYVLYGMNALGKEKTKSIFSAQMVDAYQLDTGLDVVLADQLDEYSAYLESLGVGAVH